jgi:hypothetical protein
VNFNHLMESKFMKRKCTVGHNECYWLPVGNIRSTHGNNVHMTMHCRHCGTREDIFLSKQDYEIQEKLILREVENVQTS